jgi:rare lipoprotein A (peptidoglycan hydrolase)
MNNKYTSKLCVVGLLTFAGAISYWIYLLGDFHYETAQVKFNNQGVVGISSWYDYRLDGIEWSKTHSTCASRDAKRYSTIKVINLENGKSIECYVNDYGPEEWTGRILDLSSYAFQQLAPLSKGLIKIKIIL